MAVESLKVLLKKEIFYHFRDVPIKKEGEVQIVGKETSKIASGTSIKLTTATVELVLAFVKRVFF
jgi:hypothetical protein